ncbi:MAG: Hpt domain-containing protein [Rhodoferax sp.]|nr:Hpt domain-containing protein [Rhodoferax sp.]
MSAVLSHGSGPRYLDVVGAMEQIGDADALREMLVMVGDALGRDVPAISALLAQGDVKGANQLLHPLKGFIPIFCKPELYGHVADVEKLSKHGDATSVAMAYAALAPELQTLEAEVAAYLRANA